MCNSIIINPYIPSPLSCKFKFMSIQHESGSKSLLSHATMFHRGLLDVEVGRAHGISPSQSERLLQHWHCHSPVHLPNGGEILYVLIISVELDL